MDFAVLGPLQCTIGADDVTPQRRREAALLCALLVDPGATLSAEALAAAIWYGAPPDAWSKALQMQVSRLRETVGRSLIETTTTGYRLAAPPTSVDAKVFETDVARILAGAAPLGEDAVIRISRLLESWRGVPFEELGEWPPAVYARERLRELRADALDAQAASRLARGVASVAELTDLVNDDPLREARWALLMTALYRAGRQTEALQAFQRARKTLTVEFGVEPGPELAALERAILDHDTRLDACGDPRSACAASLDAAEHARGRGDWELANGAVGEAVRLARAVDDPALLARAALIASGEGSVSTMDPIRSPVALLEEALAGLSPGPSALRACLHARLAVAESGTRAVEIAVADSDEAMRIAAMVDVPEAHAMALHSRIFLDQNLAHIEQRRGDALELLRVADTACNPSWRAWALPVLARIEAMRGDLAAAYDRIAELEPLAEELDHPVARYHAAYGEVLRMTVCGDYPAALRALERARDLGVRALPDPSAAALGYFGSVGIVQLLQGAVPTSFTAMDTEWPQSTMDATYRAYFAVVSSQRGDLDAAVSTLSHLGSDVLTSLPHDPYWPSLVWLLSLAFDAISDRERAKALYESAKPFQNLVIVDLGATFLGAMSHHLGLLATTFGADAIAEEHLCHALEVHERVGAGTWATKSQTALDRLAAGR